MVNHFKAKVSQMQLPMKDRIFFGAFRKGWVTFGSFFFDARLLPEGGFFFGDLSLRL
jgi:hypothetical protein